MNSWSFTGNCGRDGESKYTPNGDAVLSFTVAVKSGYGKSENTTWVNCSVWGKRAESLAPYIKKGTQVAIVGEVNNREWTDKEGVKKLSLDVRVNDLTLVGSKPAEQAAKPDNAASQDFDEGGSIPF